MPGPAWSRSPSSTHAPPSWRSSGAGEPPTRASTRSSPQRTTCLRRPPPSRRARPPARPCLRRQPPRGAAPRLPVGPGRPRAPACDVSPNECPPARGGVVRKLRDGTRARTAAAACLPPAVVLLALSTVACGGSDPPPPLCVPPGAWGGGGTPPPPRGGERGKKPRHFVFSPGEGKSVDVGDG